MKEIKTYKPLLDVSGNSTGVGCDFLLQGTFPTQGLNLGLPHCQQTLPSEVTGKAIHKDNTIHKDKLKMD